MLKILPVENPSREVHAVWAYWLILSQGSKAKAHEHSAKSIVRRMQRDLILLILLDLSA